MSTIIDLHNDNGFSVLVDMVKEGSLSLLKSDTDIDELLQKQAYAELHTFADPVHKMFSVATPQEAYISARYAEKCANELMDDTIAKINEACSVFNIPVEVAKHEVMKVANEMFVEEEHTVEKYAGVTDYGTEFETAMAARAYNLPEYAEDYEELSKLASSIPADKMVQILGEVDANAGADLPWMQNHVGTPEYAVFEKRASQLMVNLGSKSVAFEKLAEMQDTINDMGIDVDFDANDAYTTKLALESLPTQLKHALARYM